MGNEPPSSGVLLATQIGLGAVSTAANAFSESEAIKAEGKFKSAQARAAERDAERAAKEAEKRGGIEASRVRRAGKRLIGEQRVTLAAQGIDITEEDAADIQAETRRISALDELTIKNNASREAFGFRSAGASAALTGRFAEISSRTRSRDTLITGGLQFARQSLRDVRDVRGTRTNRITRGRTR